MGGEWFGVCIVSTRCPDTGHYLSLLVSFWTVTHTEINFVCFFATFQFFRISISSNESQFRRRRQAMLIPSRFPAIPEKSESSFCVFLVRAFEWIICLRVMCISNHITHSYTKIKFVNYQECLGLHNRAEANWTRKRLFSTTIMLGTEVSCRSIKHHVQAKFCEWRFILKFGCVCGEKCIFLLGINLYNCNHIHI